MQRNWWWYCSDWTCQRFNFWPHQALNSRTSGSLVPALYYCATATSGFHLWQFQVFNSGAEGLVVVLFWLDLSRDIFFLGTLGYEPEELCISSPTLYHSAPWHLLVVISDNFRYLNLVQRHGWWYCSKWTCERFSFWPHWGLIPGTSGSLGPALYHWTMATSSFHLWQFQVFNSDAEGLVVLLFWLGLWEILFLGTLGYEPRTSGSLVLHSTNVPQQHLVFISDNFRYLTLVQRIGGGIDLIGPVRDFLFDHTRFWTWDLWISSPALYHCATVTSGFHLWQFQVFNSGAEGLVVLLFWLDLWEIFFLATLGFEPGTSGSLILHSTTAPQQLLVFISDNFRYLTLVQRDWWWYCSDWTCERFSFWPHQGLNPRTLDL